MININGSDDDFYRYKMAIVRVSFGRNTTIIQNMKQIEKDINTPEEIIFKYLARSFGSSYNNKNNSLNGLFSRDEIQYCIYDYIHHFVICSCCGIPELSYELINNKTESKCSACGMINSFKSNEKGFRLIERYLVNDKKWTRPNGLIL